MNYYKVTKIEDGEVVEYICSELFHLVQKHYSLNYNHVLFTLTDSFKSDFDENPKKQSVL